MLVFEGEGRRWWQSDHPRKQAVTLVFEGEGRWWWWQRVTLENEHMRSFSREGVVVLMWQGGALLVVFRMGVRGEQVSPQ